MEKVISLITIIVIDGEVADPGCFGGLIFQIYAIGEQEGMGKLLLKEN